MNIAPVLDQDKHKVLLHSIGDIKYPFLMIRTFQTVYETGPFCTIRNLKNNSFYFLPEAGKNLVL